VKFLQFLLRFARCHGMPPYPDVRCTIYGIFFEDYTWKN
jgi:hypothetical protein